MQRGMDKHSVVQCGTDAKATACANVNQAHALRYQTGGQAAWFGCGRGQAKGVPGVGRGQATTGGS